MLCDTKKYMEDLPEHTYVRSRRTKEFHRHKRSGIDPSQHAEYSSNEQIDTLPSGNVKLQEKEIHARTPIQLREMLRTLEETPCLRRKISDGYEILRTVIQFPSMRFIKVPQ